MAIVELITAVAVGALLMEAPHWYEPNQSLYFVDIFTGEISRYDRQNDVSYKATIDGLEGIKTGFILPVEGRSNEFVVAVNANLEHIFWNGVTPKATRLGTLSSFDLDLNTTRFNDGKADRRGRIFGGTIVLEDFGRANESDIGSLYRRTSTGAITKLKRDLFLSNGLAWNDSPNSNKFYFIDSLRYNIWEYDYNEITGDISNERVLIEFFRQGEEPTFIADGMTIDENGDLWVALFEAGKVAKVSGRTGEILEEVVIPGVPQVTSAAFGGPNLDELYVTTGSLNGFPSPNGGLFRIRDLGVKGTRMYNARI